MGFDLSGKRVAVLGAGKMGGILLKALLEKGLLSPKSTFATVQHEERARAPEHFRQATHYLCGGFSSDQPD